MNYYIPLTQLLYLKYNTATCSSFQQATISLYLIGKQLELHSCNQYTLKAEMSTLLHVFIPPTAKVEYKI